MFTWETCRDVMWREKKINAMFWLFYRHTRERETLLFMGKLFTRQLK